MLSFLLCCHRINLKVHVNASTRDVRSLMLLKVLETLPCPHAFSVQLFIRVWNSVRHGFSIGQYEDICSLSDGIIGHLNLPNNTSGVPVLTKFLASYVCHHCGHSEQGLEDWDPKSFSKIPVLNVSQQNNPLQIGPLMTTFVRCTFSIRCSHCNRIT